MVNCHTCSGCMLILATSWEIQTSSNMFQPSRCEKRKTDLQELLKEITNWWFNGTATLQTCNKSMQTTMFLAGDEQHLPYDLA